MLVVYCVAGDVCDEVLLQKQVFTKGVSLLNGEVGGGELVLLLELLVVKCVIADDGRSLCC